MSQTTPPVPPLPATVDAVEDIVDPTVRYWRKAAQDANGFEQAALCLREAYNHAICQIHAQHAALSAATDSLAQREREVREALTPEQLYFAEKIIEELRRKHRATLTEANIKTLLRYVDALRSACLIPPATSLGIDLNPA